MDQRTAQGINLLFFLPTAASALVCHARGGYLDKPTLKGSQIKVLPLTRVPSKRSMVFPL